MPMVDGEFVPYDEWFPFDSPSRDKWDDYFMHFNKGAPKEGEAVVGYRVFYRSPSISNTKEIEPSRLYGIMQHGLHMDAVAAHGGANLRFVTDSPESIPESQFFGEAGPVEVISGGSANMKKPYEEGGIPNHGDFFFWPTREIAEEYMKAYLQAQQKIEEPHNASLSFTYRHNEPRTIQFNPRDDEEAIYMRRGHYELHRVYGTATKTVDNVAGWQMTDMQIDPEVLVSLGSDEPAASIHGTPKINDDAWNHRYG